MKRITLIILAGLIALTVGLSQNKKVEESSYKLPSNKKAELDLKFASNIKISSWSSNELSLKTIIEYSKEEFLKVHQMEVKEGSNALVINTDYDMDDYQDNKHQCWNCDDDEKESDKDKN